MIASLIVFKLIFFGDVIEFIIFMVGWLFIFFNANVATKFLAMKCCVYTSQRKSVIIINALNDHSR